MHDVSGVLEHHWDSILQINKTGHQQYQKTGSMSLKQQKV